MEPLRLQFYPRKEERWIFEQILEQMRVKRSMGIDTSLSFELGRLCRIGMTGDFTYQSRLLRKASKLGLCMAFQIPREHIDIFKEFMTIMYGSVLTTSPFKFELFRGMVQETSLVLIRELPLRSQEIVEVFISNKTLAKEIEEKFNNMVSANLKETQTQDGIKDE